MQKQNPKYKQEIPFPGLLFMQTMQDSGLLNEVTMAMCLDVLSDPNGMKVMGEYSDDLAFPLLLSQLSKKPFKNPPPEVDGLLKFAIADNKQIVGINPEECHVLIAGQTGTGKSTLLKILFSQALLLRKKQDIKEQIVNWLFVKAQDMRELLKISPDILVVPFDEIKLNPLEPVQGMKETEWASVFADLWIQAFRLYEGSKGFLIECLNSLYSKNKESGQYPNLFDLFYYVKSLQFPAVSRNSRYQESILNRLGSLIYGSLSPVFKCSRGHISNLINTHAVFEILYLTSEQQVFIVNYLLSFLFYHKIFHDKGLRHFVGVDDANLIFDRSFEQRPDLGLPIIHHLLTTVRKNKINLFVCSQTPHQLGASIHSNAFAKIIFSLSNGHDLEFMFRSMGIKNEEQKAYCYKLAPREMVVKFSTRYQDPFTAVVPEVQL